ncbi:MAG TPA: gliding motility-associated C-terminal domain-containing protein, partial [Flavobacteriales bacterium]|nr:gliding motility-associated C-terminal domain-containing protein [Flavobacteriales bacterium]
LVYKNIYPFTDVVFEFPRDSCGIKYTIYLHPGADVSKIKLTYPYQSRPSLVNGNIEIMSPIGKLVDHKPFSYIESSGEVIASRFDLANQAVGFKLGNLKEVLQTVVIDPFTVIPAFGVSNAAFDVDYDNAGNVYAYGGPSAGPYSLLKYDAAGTLLWSYTPSLFVSTVYGDFTVDRNTGNVYLSEGLNSPPGAQVVKINASAVQLAAYSGNFDFTEIWRIAFSPCTSQLILAGGGGWAFSAGYQTATLDTNLSTISLVDYVPSFEIHHDVGLLTLDDNGNCYQMTTRAVYASDSLVYDNTLVKLPLPGLTPTTWNVAANYKTRELSSMTYYGASSGLYANGYNGLCTYDTLVYSYDGYVLKQWQASTGSMVSYNRINYPAGGDSTQLKWGGIDADRCGNLFVADSNAVLQFDTSLTLINTYTQPGIVTDVRISDAGTLYVCGLGFVSSVVPTGLLTCNASFTLSSLVDDATCFSTGTATVVVTGGTPPYTYLWSDGQTTATATGLAPGTYTCTVTDAQGCNNVQVISVTVNGPTDPVVNVTTTDPLCFGASNGWAAANVSGGAAPYTYSWSNGQTTSTATGMGAGPWSVTVTDSLGCSTTQTFTLVDPAAIVVSTVSTPSACTANTGTATATANGGTAPYSYVWTPGSQTTAVVTGLGVGNYTVTVTDSNGCTQSQTVTVVQANNPVISITATPATIAPGGSTQLNASGGISYAWTPSSTLSCSTCPNPLATPGETTIYCVTGTDSNGCTDTACIKVTLEIPCGEIFVPTAFSPNKDGANEMQCVLGNCIAALYFAIFDRWGEKVFETHDQKMCWDGTYKGKVMNTAVFVYYLEATFNSGETITRKGNITLVR